MAHKLLIEIVCSAKHERFFRLLQLAVTRADPKDETALFECLNVFKAGSAKARQKLLRSTDHNQLKNKWVENCDATELSAILDSKSLPEQIELLELCSEKMEAAIEKSLGSDEEKMSEFEMLKLSKFLG